MDGQVKMMLFNISQKKIYLNILMNKLSEIMLNIVPILTKTMSSNLDANRAGSQLASS